MSQDAYEKVRDLLPQLSRDQLELIRKRIASKLSVMGDGPPSHSGPQEEDYDMVLTALVSVARDAGIGQMPVVAVKRTSTVTTHREKLLAVTRWIKERGDRKTQLGILNLGSRLLLDDLRRGIPVRWDSDQKRLVRYVPAPVTMRELIIYCDRIPGIIESNFPGYIGSGLLGHIVNPDGDIDVRTK